ncbi:CbiX/SirB N-terminal domain-containing protein [Halospeciosus flavus]|uniref:CbiX/SirB N-terminal domain-containing protein n=1 Tax=Halospeciosus flavus TaxID=3032283 RepID=A0ABD5Z2K6_9EURY
MNQGQALVVVGHGSHLNPGSSEPAFAHADTIRETGAFDEVREAFWKEEPSVREVLRTLESEEVFVVPLFVSEGYFTEEVVPRELRLEGWDDAGWDSDGTDADHVTLEPTDVEKTVHYCGPVGTHDSMSDVIVQRARSVMGGDETGNGDEDGIGAEVGLAVVGHGTERNENSAKAIYYHAERIREAGLFAEVRALFMDEEPVVDDVTDHFEATDVVVVPLFVADGFHTQEDIPEDVGLTDDFREGWDVPATVDGHRIWYAGAVGTEPLVADVVLERAVEAGADATDAVERVRERAGGNDTAVDADAATGGTGGTDDTADADADSIERTEHTDETDGPWAVGE